jgi:tetratricopeptide (TPR) repeat protein/predicted Ser/Thr protein kinase
MAHRPGVAAPGNRPFTVSASSRTDPARWRQVKRLLEETFERPAGERSAFIAQACGEDEVLRRDVESLAAAADASWNILDAPAGSSEGPLEPSRTGERIGPYELIGELGRGGMGVVYLARRADEEFEQKVAVKFLSGGLADEVSRERFRSERQIVASLDHPHIARLLDGGTTAAGEPFFVMEYVEGEPLLDYCRQRSLSIRQRLRLFQDVCSAVQYAHQHLVVHRDLKPDNILVTADGRAKLLDFGIAKLIDSTGAPRGGKTATLYRMFTPDYASPEQVRARPVTTASDVYGLGVVLYELLTGRKPYHVESPEPAELLRLVCEKDPEKPSVIAGSRELRGDLDSIVARAMRKEPERRYASASALSEDIERHLSGRPVLARRGTASYRTGKFFRRHRLAIGAASLLLVALGGGVWATLREARRARAAEARAEHRFNDVRRLANSFLFEFHDAIRDLPGSTPARALVVKRALEYLDSLAEESAGDRALRRELAEAYRRVGDAQGNPFMANLGDLKGAVASYRKSIALLEPDVGPGSGSDQDRSVLAASYLVGSGLVLTEGRATEALEMAKKGLALRQGLADGRPGDAQRQMDLSQAWQYVAFDASAAGRNAEAAAALAAQAVILQRRHEADPGDRGVRRSLGQNLYLSGEALARAGRLDDALARYREAEGFQRELARDDPASVSLRRDLAYTYTQIGNAQLALGAAAAGLPEYDRALAAFQGMAAADPRSTDAALGVAMSYHNTGEALAMLGRRGEALRAFGLARPRYEAIVAAAPSNAWVTMMLATLYVKIAELQEVTDRASACDLYGRAVSLFGPLAAAGPLAADRQQLFEKARAFSTACP